MVRIGILLVAILLAFNADAEKNQTPMEFACEQLDIDCTGIRPPDVIITELMGALGLYGAYMPGENRIYIDPDAPSHTLVHEVTHYVVYEAGFRFDRCFSEEVARIVHHRWNGTEYSDSWRKTYGCEKPAEE
jgi:hypothetical protein